MKFNKKNNYNISIYTSGAFPFGDAPANYVRLMATGLKELDCEIFVHLLSGFWYNSTNEEDYQGIKFKPLFLRRKPKNFILKFIGLFTNIILLPGVIVFDKIYRKTDVIIIYGIEYFYFLFWFQILCPIFGIKSIRILSDVYKMSTISPNIITKPKILFYNIQKKYFDKYFSGIVCLSQYLYDEKKKSGIRVGKLIIIPHFIEITPLNYNYEESAIYQIAYCGTFTIENGVIDLLEAFKIFKGKFESSKLLLIGDPNRLSLHQRQFFDKTIHELKDFVYVTGRVNSIQVKEYLIKSDLLINPRQKSILADAGFPTKLGEYLATKKPVISTRVGDIGNYFNSQKALLLAEPNNPTSIAEQMIKIKESPLLSKSLSETGYAWALENLYYRNSAKKLFNFITHLKK